jgi:hypothetical protein
MSFQSFWRMDRWQTKRIEGTMPLSTDFEFTLPASVHAIRTMQFFLL